MFEASLLKYSLEAAQIYRWGEKNSIACLHTKLFVKTFYLAVYHERGLSGRKRNFLLSKIISV